MFLCVSNARSYTNKTVHAQEMANESLQKLAHAINRDFFSFKDWFFFRWKTLIFFLFLLKIEILSNKKISIPCRRQFLLYKSGVQGGMHYTDMFSWWISELENTGIVYVVKTNALINCACSWSAPLVCWFSEAAVQMWKRQPVCPRNAWSKYCFHNSCERTCVTIGREWVSSKKSEFLVRKVSFELKKWVSS